MRERGGARGASNVGPRREQSPQQLRPLPEVARVEHLERAVHLGVAGRVMAVHPPQLHLLAVGDHQCRVTESSLVTLQTDYVPSRRNPVPGDVCETDALPIHEQGAPWPGSDGQHGRRLRQKRHPHPRSDRGERLDRHTGREVTRSRHDDVVAARRQLARFAPAHELVGADPCGDRHARRLQPDGAGRARPETRGPCEVDLRDEPVAGRRLHEAARGGSRPHYRRGHHVGVDVEVRRQAHRPAQPRGCQGILPEH